MWEYRASCIKVIDGDTVRLHVDHGGDIFSRWDLRLLDVHAPELDEPGGRETAAYVTEWMSHVDMRRNWPLLIRTDKTTALEPSERRSFTRYLARVWRIDEIAPSLNEDVTGFLAGHPEWGVGQ